MCGHKIIFSELGGQPLSDSFDLSANRLPENAMLVRCSDCQQVDRFNLLQLIAKNGPINEQPLEANTDLSLSSLISPNCDGPSPSQSSNTYFAAACPTPRSSSPGQSGVGLLCQFAAHLQNQRPDLIAELCGQLPLPCLLPSIPLLVGINHPSIVAFLEQAVRSSEVFASRFWMITNDRPAFKHLDALTKAVPASPFLELCLHEGHTFQKGQVIPVEGHHPFTFEPITEVKVDHVFSSLARPLILSFPGTHPPEMALLSVVAAESYCRVLMKQGEDIFHETAIQVLFKALNEMWSDHLPPALRPFICSFREVPSSPSMGFLQIVEGCKDLEVIERDDFAEIPFGNSENFIRTTCGWCLAAYLLGLSDRHRENTLVRISDGSAIPIDFGFMLGNAAPSVNTYQITVSAQMYEYLQRVHCWPFFATMFVAGFMAIRENAETFLTLAAHLFTGHRNPAFVRKFISHRLLLKEQDRSRVFARIVRRLRHAPVCSDTRRKIDNHRKNKEFLAKHGKNFLVRMIISRAVEAPPEINPEGLFHCIHNHRVELSFPHPEDFPSGTPEYLMTFFESSHAKANDKAEDERHPDSMLFTNVENSPVPVDSETAAQFLETVDSPTDLTDSTQPSVKKMLIRGVKSFRLLRALSPNSFERR